MSTPTPWPQTGGVGGSPPVNFDPTVSAPGSMSIPDTAAGLVEFIANLIEMVIEDILDLPLEIFDMLCSLFTGQSVTGTTGNSFMSGTQGVMNSLCSMFTGQSASGTSGKSMMSGAQDVIGTGSGMITGDTSAIGSGSGLISGFQGVMDSMCSLYTGTPSSETNAATVYDGTSSVIGTGSSLLTGDSGSIGSGLGLLNEFITVLNVLCSLCTGLTGAERAMVRRRIGGQRLGVVTPLVNATTLVDGITGWIGTGSKHLTGDPGAITSGSGLATAAQSKLDAANGLFGGVGTGVNAVDVITKGALYQSDAVGLLGNPTGLGSGSAAANNDADSVPVLGPVNAKTKAIIDSLYGGLTGATTTGKSPSDVGNAAAQLTSNVGAVSAISQDSAAAIALQALNVPAYHAVDPTLSAVFDLFSLTGTTSSTISVVAADTAMGFINIQTTSLKRSLAMICYKTGTITGAYINVYLLGGTTLTPVWSSGDISSFLPTSEAWLYSTIGTPFVVTQGQWYAMELQVVGSGNVTLVGLPNHWAPANTSVVPQQLGAARATVGGVTTPPSSITSIPYAANVPWFGLSSESAQSAYVPQVYFEDIGGTFTLTGLPPWANVADVVLVGSGSTGDNAKGIGGAAGQASSVTIGTETVTAAGGAFPSQSSGLGASPGPETYNGITYQGGAAAAQGQPGISPGGGSGGILGETLGPFGYVPNCGDGGNAGSWAAATIPLGSVTSISGVVGDGPGNAADGAVWVILRQQTIGTPTISPVLTGSGRLSATAESLLVKAQPAGHGALAATAYQSASRTAALPGHGVLSATAVSEVVFDATGSGGHQASGTLLSGTHNAAPGAYVIVAVDNFGSNTISSITYAGTAMTYLGHEYNDNSSSAGNLAFYGIASPPTGLQTIDITFSGSTQAAFGSVSYLCVGSVGAAQTTFANAGGTVSQAVTCAAKQMIVHAFGAIGTLSSPAGGNSRYTDTSETSAKLQISDATVSTTFSITGSKSGGQSGVAVVLSPV